MAMKLLKYIYPSTPTDNGYQSLKQGTSATARTGRVGLLLLATLSLLIVITACGTAPVVLPGSPLPLKEHPKKYIYIKNFTNHKVEFALYYIDHPLKDEHPGQLYISGGDIPPQRVYQITSTWGFGRYQVVVQGPRGFMNILISASPNAAEVSIKPPLGEGAGEGEKL